MSGDGGGLLSAHQSQKASSRAKFGHEDCAPQHSHSHIVTRRLRKETRNQIMAPHPQTARVRTICRKRLIPHQIFQFFSFPFFYSFNFEIPSVTAGSATNKNKHMASAQQHPSREQVSVLHGLLVESQNENEMLMAD